jgi:hypothetical protein
MKSEYFLIYSFYILFFCQFKILKKTTNFLNRFGFLFCSLKLNKYFNFFWLLFYLPIKKPKKIIPLFFLYPSWELLIKFSTKLCLQGKTTAYYIFQSFYLLFKKLTRTFYFARFPLYFFRQYFLPFRLRIVIFSNRAYYFPVPFQTDAQKNHLLLKKFTNKILRLRKETTFFQKFFFELRNFLHKSKHDSYFYAHLEKFFLQGIENRAFVHYRWLLPKDY